MKINVFQNTFKIFFLRQSPPNMPLFGFHPFYIWSTEEGKFFQKVFTSILCWINKTRFKEKVKTIGPQSPPHLLLPGLHLFYIWLTDVDSCKFFKTFKEIDSQSPPCMLPLVYIHFYWINKTIFKGKVKTTNPQSPPHMELLYIHFMLD